MSKVIPFQKLHIAVGAIAGTAICIFFWQPAPMSLPKTTTDVTSETPKLSPRTASFSQTKAYFDLSVLPEEPAPVVVQQIIAPDVTIQRYNLQGVTSDSHNAIALISDGSISVNLKLGDSFEGFIVSAIEARRIEFTAGEIVSTLELPF